jgi:type IV pilus assembly protein PilQ
VPLETRIVKINFANASELQGPIQSALTRRGTVQSEKRTNSLIITDVSAVVESAERMARELDSTTPQIEITAKIVDVDAEALRGMGIEWNVGGYDADTDGMEFFDGTPPIPPHAPNPGDDPDNAIVGDHNTPIADPATRIAYGIFKDWGSLEVQLQLLEQNRKANIISNPRITTVESTTARPRSWSGRRSRSSSRTSRAIRCRSSRPSAFSSGSPRTSRTTRRSSWTSIPR